jgi:hypothetical protein
MKGPANSPSCRGPSFDLYGDEPFEASILTRLKALPEPFADWQQWPADRNAGKAARAGEWDKAPELHLAGLAESNAPVSRPITANSPRCCRKSGIQPGRAGFPGVQ